MRRILWLTLGFALLAVGVTLALTSRATEASDFGWFAYTPLEGDTEFADWSMGWDDGGRAYLVSRGSIIGAGLGGLGLVVLATGVAYALGRRQRPTA